MRPIHRPDAEAVLGRWRLQLQMTTAVKRTLVLIASLFVLFLRASPCGAQCDRDVKECHNASTFPSLNCTFPPCPQADPYLLYVWRDGYHPENVRPTGLFASSPCGDAMHSNPSSGSSAVPECWEHNWEGWDARSDLWAATTRPLRTVGLVLAGSVRSRLESLAEDGWPRNAAGRCDDELFWLLRTNHCHGARVYALFADGDANFSERERIPLVGWYNGNCSDGVAADQFDGAAANNEHFSSVRCDYQEGIGSDELAWLDRLHDAAQLADPLPLHLSVGWTWSRCTNATDGSHYSNVLPWSPPGGGPPVPKPALQHMYDTVSSVDVQVAHTSPSTVLSRLDWADYAYHSAVHPAREMYALAYANYPPGTSPSDPAVCASTHHYVYPPGDGACGTPSGEAGMFAAFEALEGGRPHARGGVHSMRKGYASGVAADWLLVPLGPSFAYVRCILSAVTLADAAKKLREPQVGVGGGAGAGGTVRVDELAANLRNAREAVVRAEGLAKKLREEERRGEKGGGRDSAGRSFAGGDPPYAAPQERRRRDGLRREMCALLRSATADLRRLRQTLDRLAARDGPAVGEALHDARGVPGLWVEMCADGRRR